MVYINLEIVILIVVILIEAIVIYSFILFKKGKANHLIPVNDGKINSHKEAHNSSNSARPYEDLYNDIEEETNNYEQDQYTNLTLDIIRENCKTNSGFKPIPIWEDQTNEQPGILFITSGNAFISNENDNYSAQLVDRWLSGSEYKRNNQNITIPGIARVNEVYISPFILHVCNEKDIKLEGCDDQYDYYVPRETYEVEIIEDKPENIEPNMLRALTINVLKAEFLWTEKVDEGHSQNVSLPLAVFTGDTIEKALLYQISTVIPVQILESNNLVKVMSNNKENSFKGLQYDITPEGQLKYNRFLCWTLEEGMQRSRRDI